MVVCELREIGTWQDRPVVVVEVLSESTRRIDFTEKREVYLAIPALKALIFVEPYIAHVSVLKTDIELIHVRLCGSVALFLTASHLNPSNQR